MVEGTSLENWRTRKGIVSSNLTLSVLYKPHPITGRVGVFIGARPVGFRFGCSVVIVGERLTLGTA